MYVGVPPDTGRSFRNVDHCTALIGFLRIRTNLHSRKYYGQAFFKVCAAFEDWIRTILYTWEESNPDAAFDLTTQVQIL